MPCWGVLCYSPFPDNRGQRKQIQPSRGQQDPLDPASDISTCPKSSQDGGFLKIGLPSNHPFYIVGLSIIKHPAIGVPP